MTDQQATDKRIAETFFLVEATSFEKHMLWADWHNKVCWAEISLGYFQEIGKLDKRPICVSVCFAKIWGRIVAFYEGTSQVVDHALIEAWVQKTFPTPTWGGGRWAHCDAMNFHLCLQAIREANARQLAPAAKRKTRAVAPKKRAKQKTRRY